MASVFLLSSSSTFFCAVSKTSSLSHSTATKKSFAVTFASNSGVARPMLWAISTFRSVPMPTSASFTPSSFFRSLEMSMRVTESK